MTPVEFRRVLWHHKTRTPGLSYGVIYVIPHFVVSVELRTVTNRRTDRHSAIAYTARSTQSPGSLNRVPASAGVRAGMSPLPDGRYHTVIPCGM